MRKTLLALIAGGMLVGVGARAQGPGPQGGQKGTSETKAQKPTMGTAGTKADEPKKHLGEMDVYLKDAINNVKVVYETTQLEPGKLDATIEREGLTNIDKAISGAMTHVSHIKSMPEAHVIDMASLDLVQKDLTQAKSMLTQLRTAVKNDNREQVAMLSSQLYARLKDADDAFSTLADKQNFTRVDKIMVPERQPVGGQEQPGGEKMPEKPMPEKQAPEKSQPPSQGGY
jgi:hypothetical protein